MIMVKRLKKLLWTMVLAGAVVAEPMSFGRLTFENFVTDASDGVAGTPGERECIHGLHAPDVHHLPADTARGGSQGIFAVHVAYERDLPGIVRFGRGGCMRTGVHELRVASVRQVPGLFPPTWA